MVLRDLSCLEMLQTRNSQAIWHDGRQCAATSVDGHVHSLGTLQAESTSSRTILFISDADPLNDKAFLYLSLNFMPLYTACALFRRPRRPIPWFGHAVQRSSLSLFMCPSTTAVTCFAVEIDMGRMLVSTSKKSA